MMIQNARITNKFTSERVIVSDKSTYFVFGDVLT
jgi:hypothetical protein